LSDHKPNVRLLIFTVHACLGLSILKNLAKIGPVHSEIIGEKQQHIAYSPRGNRGKPGRLNNRT